MKISFSSIILFYHQHNLHCNYNLHALNLYCQHHDQHYNHCHHHDHHLYIIIIYVVINTIAINTINTVIVAIVFIITVYLLHRCFTSSSFVLLLSTIMSVFRVSDRFFLTA